MLPLVLVCMGIEPTTFGLQDQRSADWANKPSTGNLSHPVRKYCFFIAVCSLSFSGSLCKIIFKIDYNIIIEVFIKPLVHVGLEPTTLCV